MNEVLVKSEIVEGGVCVLTIDRPKSLNALNQEVLLQLKKALEAAKINQQVKVIILTGAGEKAFIAGADIQQMATMSSQQGVAFAKLGHEVSKLLELMPKPTLAAVNGFALGGGTEMAISCDFIYCSENAVFGQPEVGLGIIPGFGGTVRLSRFVGLPRAKELIFSGRKIKAHEALEMGLVNRVFPQKDLLKETILTAQTIAKNSAPAVSVCKRLLNEFSESTGLNYKLDAEAQEFGGLFGSHNQKEGMQAFIDKREARFGS